MLKLLNPPNLITDSGVVMNAVNDSYASLLATIGKPISTTCIEVVLFSRAKVYRSATM